MGCKALAMEESPRTETVRCPHCGYGAGIYRAPAEDRTPSTPIRCLACRGEAVLEDWSLQTEGMIDRFMQDNGPDTGP